jgi:glucokinase
MKTCKPVVKWLNPDAAFNRLVLAGDIGGTNTNLALVGITGSKFTIIVEGVYPSQEIDGLAEPIRELLHIARQKRSDLVAGHGCVCAAGPVAKNCCVMTNLPWSIDGDALSRELGMEIIVINDFLGISYGIPTLDVNNPQQIHVLQHPDGSTPPSHEAMKAVIGPGTGMGVGILAWDGTHHVPASSEGGHINFAPFDKESAEFRDYMKKKTGKVPEIEVMVSGLGIQNLYEWWRDTKGVPKNEAWAQIESTDPPHRPKLISRLSDSDPSAASIMRLFTRMLGRFAGDVATILLPFGGFYLAGGVAQKELRWIEGDHLFMKWFEETFNPNIRPLLQKIPVYLIKDYSISIYGAANACQRLSARLNP